MGGISGELPVATTTALRATSVSSPGTHAALAVEAAGAAHDGHVPLLEPGHLARVVEVVDDLVAALQHGLHVEVAGHRLAHAGNAAHLGEQLAGAQQPLRRHARVEGALAADQVRLHDRHGQPLLAQAPGADLPGRSGSENHHIEFALAHAVTVLCLHGHRRRAPQAGPRRPPQALHLHRGAPSAPRVDPLVRDQGARSARGGVGGDDLPRLGLRAHGRARLPGALLSRGVRRPGRRLLLQPRARRGDGALQLRRPGDGRGGAHRHGDSAGATCSAPRSRSRSYLVPAIRGEKISCLGITEPDAGSDVSGHQDARRARRRRLGHQRLEDLHHERAPRRLHRARDEDRPGRGLRRLHAVPGGHGLATA